MKLQFQLSTLFKVMTCVAVAGGGLAMILQSITTSTDRHILLLAFTALSPIWVSLIFLGFAAGRQALRPTMVFAYLVAELTAIAVFALTMR